MIHLDYKDSRPIYEQVADRLKELMILGVLEEDGQMPSVRSLATELSINPNTIQRAYEALEAEGYLCSVQGKGSFAAPHAGVDEGRRRQLLNSFDGVCTELFCLGMDGETLAQRLRTLEGGIRQ